jgi:hypothetical protein
MDIEQSNYLPELAQKRGTASGTANLQGLTVKQAATMMNVSERSLYMCRE